MATVHHVDASRVHYAWDSSLEPRLVIEPGDVVIFDTRDAADGYYRPDSTHDDVRTKGPFLGHPLTGPVYVRGARPGDVIVVEILEVVPRRTFGWTAIRPGIGLCPPYDLATHFLQIWDIADGNFARMLQRRDVAVPMRPFPGVIGTALPESGSHSTVPPRRNGGNMDIRQLTSGARLLLPVSVDGALVSVGDAHAAQGDGEVCGTGIEMCATVRLRIGLETGLTIPEPQFWVPSSKSSDPYQNSSYYVTTAHGPNLFECAQKAISYMIAHLTGRRGLTPEEAYVLCSVAADLKINEIVDTPSWIVSASLPDCVFTNARQSI
jgi:acetamidase/formamidase